MSTRHYAFLITLLLSMARSAYGDIAGTWQLAQKPKVSVSVYGAPVTSLKLPKLPASDQIVFKADPGFPGTGTFQSSMFEGGWKQSKSSFKGTPTKTIVEAIMSEYLAKGTMYGFTFNNGYMAKSSNKLVGTEARNGTISGSFTHISTWKINITSPKKMVAPVQVKLVVPFKGTRAAAGE